MQWKHKNSCVVLFTVLSFLGNVKIQSQIKSMVYDFDGLDIGSSNIPEGDYSYGDLNYQIAANPLPSSDMMGDRVLKLNLNWNLNYGSFGRGVTRFIEFDVNKDVLNFFFYNPISNGQNAILEVNIGDDDNDNRLYENTSDDTWKKSLTIELNIF